MQFVLIMERMDEAVKKDNFYSLNLMNEELYITL